MQQYRDPSLLNVMGMVGFNPNKIGNAWFLIMSDIHFYKATSGTIPDQTILDPRIQNACTNVANYPPTKIVINGDLCSNLCVSMGSGLSTAEGIIETGYAQPWMNWLEAIAPLKIIVGNHDTPAPIEADYVGKFLDSKITQFTPGYESGIYGGVRVAWINQTNGGDVIPPDLSSWKQDVASLTPGQDMVTFHHLPSNGWVNAGMRTAYTSAMVVNSNLNNNFYSIAGHDHLFGEGVSLFNESCPIYWWSISCGQVVEEVPSASADNTGASVSAICVSGGKVVARMAMDCKEGLWWLWKINSTTAASQLIPRDGNVTQTSLVKYLEGEYTRNTTNGPISSSGGSTYLNCNSWLVCTGNMVMKFTVPTQSVGMWVLNDNRTVTVGFSSDNLTWTWVQLEDVGNYATCSIPLALRGVSPLYVKHTSSGNYGGCGFY